MLSIQPVNFNKIQKQKIVNFNGKYKEIEMPKFKSGFADAFDKGLEKLQKEESNLVKEKDNCLIPAWVPFSKARRLKEEIRLKNCEIEGFTNPNIGRKTFEAEDKKHQESFDNLNNDLQKAANTLIEDANFIFEKFSKSQNNDKIIILDEIMNNSIKSINEIKQKAEEVKRYGKLSDAIRNTRIAIEKLYNEGKNQKIDEI